MLGRRWRSVGVLLLVVGRSPATAASFTTFESGQVRPLAMSPDGTRLFAVNTPDDRLEMFTVGAGGLTPAGSVTVGLEPVAVAARTNTEVWVVNHLSDSVSVVDVGATPPRVVRTLLVGDEPRDIVFAGPGGNRAFITTAHRGQNSPVDPQLTTEGIGRADVFVFDATNLGTTLTGTPLTVLTLFGDTPRALAVAPGGGTVYAAVFHSGNRTATVSEGAVCNGGAAAAPCTVGGVTIPGGLPAPNTNFQGTKGPETSLIVKFNPANGRWEDRLARNWSPAIKFSLPDKDVFSINANANPPTETASFAGVGTVLFNMAVNPVSGRVYVTNGDAHNEVRFEGPGTFGGSTVRGHLHEARITVLDGATVTPHHLNKHINYAVVPSPTGTKDASLATPMGMAVTSNGLTLYVAAFGSSAIGVFNTTQLETNTFTPSAASHIAVSGGGPSGLVLDEARSRLYVFTRFDNAISVINTTTNAEIAHLPVYNPEPPSVVAGRPFLYDAFATSSNGEAACASCHIFGDFDSLAWDLGNPDDVIAPNANPFRVIDPIGMSFVGFHPMKGPMATQSLRGMANAGPMHWRGDRTGSSSGGSALDEDAAFKAFNVAFGGLLGRSGPLAAGEMQAFTDFILQVTYPPNPIRDLTNVDTPEQGAGRNFFMTSTPSDVFQSCNGCHHLDPALGFFGTDGFSSFEFETQNLKIPHLRNLYQKVGMFGMTSVPFVNPGDNGNKGDQVRGFGFLHDGSTDTIFRFHDTTVFNQTNPGGLPVPNPGGIPNGAAGDPLRRQIEAFMLAFDSNLAPMVGQQLTLTGAGTTTVLGRIALMESQATAGACDLVVKGVAGGLQRGWLRTVAGTYRPDRFAEPLLTSAQLRALATTAGQALTYTCVPPGSGLRVGVDRDEDGWFDRDEIDAGTDPADPSDFPAGTTTTTSTIIGTTTTSTVAFALVRGKITLRDDNTAPINPEKRKIVFKSTTKKEAAGAKIVTPFVNDAANPVSNGATLVVYNSNPAPGSPLDEVAINLVPSRWSVRAGSVSAYEYVDPSDTAKIKIRYQPDKLTITIKGPAWPYTLDEAAQGSVALQFSTNVGTFRFCSDMPAKVRGGSTAKTDTVDKFTGEVKTAPSFCPPRKGASPSGAFLDALEVR